MSSLDEKTLYPIADKLPSKLKDHNDIAIVCLIILDTTDSINEPLFTNNHVLVFISVVNMFPNIDKKSGLKSV